MLLEPKICEKFDVVGVGADSSFMNTAKTKINVHSDNVRKVGFPLGVASDGSPRKCCKHNSRQHVHQLGIDSFGYRRKQMTDEKAIPNADQPM